MWVRLVSAKLRADKVEEGIRIYNEDVIPALKAQSGNMEEFMLEPREEADDYISFTTWRSKADWEA